MRIPIAVAAATLLFSSTAFAQKQYGRAGTFEVSGTVTLQNQTEDYDDSGKTDTQSTTLAPVFGFYLMDNVELLGGLTIGNSSTESDGGGEVTGSIFTVDAGAGYFIPIGAIRLGPQLLFRYYSVKQDFGGADATDTGPGLSIGGAAKVPIGTGGLLIAGINYGDQMTTRKVPGNKEDGTVSGLTTAVGFGIYF